MTWLLSGVEWGTFAGVTRKAYFQGNVSRSGNNIILNGLSLYFTTDIFVYGTATETVKIYDVTGGNTEVLSQSVTWNLGTTESPKKVSNTAYLSNVTVAIPVSASSRTFALTAPGGDYATFTVHFDPGAVAPSDGFIDNIVPTTNSIYLTGGVNESGSGGAMQMRLCVATQPFTTSVPYNYEESHYAVDEATVTNNSSKSSGGVTLAPNNHYYVGVYADNGVLDYSWASNDDVWTLVNKATLAVEGEPAMTTTIRWNTEADGGYKNKVLEVSVNGGATYVTAATITTGSASTGTFDLGGFAPGHTYTVKSRINLGGKYIMNDDLTFSLSSDYKLYGSVNNKTKAITKLYGSVNGQTKLITKLYGSVNGVTKRIF